MEKLQFEEFKILIGENKFHELKQKLEELNKADIASFIEELPNGQSVNIFRILSKETAAGVFAFFSIDMQQLAVNTLTGREISYIFEKLFTDEAVTFLKEMPENTVKRILTCVDPQTKKLIADHLY